MRDKMRSFMSGRYGTDQLGRFTMAVCAVSLLLYMFFRFDIFYYLTILCLVSYYFRAFSRNHARRYEENLKFLQLKNRFTGRFRGFRAHMEERKVYRFYTCPQCSQKIRVPKGHGKISITCPKCRSEFVRKS